MADDFNLPEESEEVEVIADTPGAYTKQPSYPYSAMLETDSGTALFIVIGPNKAHMLNQDHPLVVTISERRLTPCKIKYVYRGPHA